jgi:Uma2 family endonuclease
VVEVLSPSTRSLDTSAKLIDYFRLPSVQHYLVVNGKAGNLIYHKRGAGESIETSVLSSGPLVLDPPGLTVAVESFFED